jgi:hypothetical protein
VTKATTSSPAPGAELECCCDQVGAAKANQLRFRYAGETEGREGSKAMGLTSVEICAGAGGQAPGLEQAGFNHEALVEIEPSFVRRKGRL